ncbi:hypothetical protein F4778DRAFT_393216 [Xylariomycetidae sp. FL2044]|nr:hypothetical protein F4778DRAFT_393216 [Xylariomycetidae sp. FL2044]
MFDLISTSLYFLLALYVASLFVPPFYHDTNPSISSPAAMDNRRGPRIPARRIPLVPRPTERRTPQPPKLSSVYETEPEDVARVKRILTKAGNLPPEVIDVILDFGEYWVCSATIIDYTTTLSQYHMIRGSRPDEDQLLLRTEPIGLTKWKPSNAELWRRQAAPKPLNAEFSREHLEKLAQAPVSSLSHPVRKITFDTISRDQGTAAGREDHGTYRYSWTWFDAGLDRFDRDHRCTDKCPGRPDPDTSQDPDMQFCAVRPVWPPLKTAAEGEGNQEPSYDHSLHSDGSHQIQRNKLAAKEWEHHHVEWRWDDDIDPDSIAARTELDAKGRGAGTGNGEFVRNLKLGDMVTVWGRARFPGWCNSVKKVEVRVYWAL